MKLFISHSSRLDDESVDSNDPEKNPNLKLLLEVIADIKQEYGESIEILVDKDEHGLPAGIDWEKRLNEWLAECHAAIILFSKRAIENSNWVKKEATILSWRRELEKDFILVPVLLNNQTTPEDLEKDLFGTLRINKSQCVPNASDSKTIVNKLKERIGGPEAVKINCADTPFDKLSKNISELLEESAKKEKLQKAWDSINEIEKPEWNYDSGVKFANALARFLLRKEKNCIHNLQCIIDIARPRTLDNAKELLSFIRCLWVDARAAGLIPGSLNNHRVVAMNGRLLMRTIEDKPNYFTIDRYIERAWPGTNMINIISIGSFKNSEDIKQDIRSKFGARNTRLSEDVVDGIINEDPQQILAYIPATNDDGGIPDSFILAELKKTYKNIIFILGCGDELPILPRDQIVPIEPELDLEEEGKQEIIENRAIQFINKMYAR